MNPLSLKLCSNTYHNCMPLISFCRFHFVLNNKEEDRKVMRWYGGRIVVSELETSVILLQYVLIDILSVTIVVSDSTFLSLPNRQQK